MALFLSKLSMQSKAGLRFMGSFSGHNQSFLGGQFLASNDILSSLQVGGHSNKSNSAVVENTDMLMDRLFSRQMQLPYAVGSVGNLETTLPASLNEVIGDLSDDVTEISVMNRNARKSRKANHGARPCSRMSRRHKKNQIGKRRRHA